MSLSSGKLIASFIPSPRYVPMFVPSGMCLVRKTFFEWCCICSVGKQSGNFIGDFMRYTLAVDYLNNSIRKSKLHHASLPKLFDILKILLTESWLVQIVSCSPARYWDGNKTSPIIVWHSLCMVAALCWASLKKLDQQLMGFMVPFCYVWNRTFCTCYSNGIWMNRYSLGGGLRTVLSRSSSSISFGQYPVFALSVERTASSTKASIHPSMRGIWYESR